MMIVGNKSKFAIESAITRAYERKSFRALGYFLIHIDEKSYGINLPDATMLACSFDKVKERLIKRGTHIFPSIEKSTAYMIADAVCTSIYLEEQQNECFFGMSRSDFCDVIYSNELLWIPDGDEAFDDGSHILQFDVEDNVRLIGFKRDSSNVNEEFHSLTDIWVDSDEFYLTLLNWYNAFESEWMAAKKWDDID